MGEWADVTLGDVLTLQRGFDLPERLRTAGPYPVVSSSGVTGTHDEFKVGPPGVVIGRYGSLGSVHWIEEPFWPLNTSLWVKDFKGNNPRFISYLLKTISIDGSSASAVPGVNRNHLHRLSVRLPSVREQCRIAMVLSKFDNLIENNERRIDLVEGLARALYQAWFIRFQYPGHEHSTLVDSSIGPVPQDWSVGRISDIAEIAVEGVEPSGFRPGECYVGLEHLPRRSTTLRRWGSADSMTSRKLRFSRGDTLFGKIRPNLHKVAWASVPGLASSDTMTFRPLGTEPPTAYLNSVLSSDQVVAEAVATANGTKMPRANPKVLLSHRIALPNKALLSTFEIVVSGWLDWSAEMVKVNGKLAGIRDLLLSRLVSGQLDISDVDLSALTAAESE